MKTIPNKIPAIAAACKMAGFAAMLAAAPCQAISLATSAQHFTNGTQDSSDSDTGTVSSSSLAVNASAYSHANGILNVNAMTEEIGVASFTTFSAPPAFPTPSGAEAAIATSRWEDTILNNTGTAVEYRYIFHVSNPRLGIVGNPGDFSSLTLHITVNGDTAYSAFMSMDDSGLTYDPILNPPVFQNSVEAYFSSFDASASLGIFNSGESFTVAYELKAYAEASDQGLFNNSFAAVGDPASPEGNPLQIIATPVPEPSSLLLLGAGLVAGALGRMR